MKISKLAKTTEEFSYSFDSAEGSELFQISACNFVALVTACNEIFEHFGRYDRKTPESRGFDNG